MEDSEHSMVLRGLLTLTKASIIVISVAMVAVTLAQVINAVRESNLRQPNRLPNIVVTVIYASQPVLQMNMFQRSPALGVQMSYIYMAIPISMGLILIICAERIVRYVRSLRGRET